MQLLHFPQYNSHACIIIDNECLIVKLQGSYVDSMAYDIARHISNRLPLNSPVQNRIWDLSEISPANFKLSLSCVRWIADWSVQLQDQNPESVSYIICPSDLAYGLARMHQQLADAEGKFIRIVRDKQILPECISLMLTKCDSICWEEAS